MSSDDSDDDLKIYPKVVLFGDSITRYSFDVKYGYYGAKLQHKIGDFYHVDCFGFCGYTSKDAVKLMPRLFPPEFMDQVAVFVVAFGANDMWESEPSGIPVDQYESNNEKVVQYLLDQGMDKDAIILPTPLWCDVPRASILSSSEAKKSSWVLTEEHGRKYRDAVLRVVEKFGIRTVDLFNLSVEFEPFESLFYDGCHLSQTGGDLVYNNLLPLVLDVIEKNFGRMTREFVESFRT